MAFKYETEVMARMNLINDQSFFGPSAFLENNTFPPPPFATKRFAKLWHPSFLTGIPPFRCGLRGYWILEPGLLAEAAGMGNGRRKPPAKDGTSSSASASASASASPGVGLGVAVGGGGDLSRAVVHPGSRSAARPGASPGDRTGWEEEPSSLRIFEGSPAASDPEGEELEAPHRPETGAPRDEKRPDVDRRAGVGVSWCARSEVQSRSPLPRVPRRLQSFPAIKTGGNQRSRAAISHRCQIPLPSPALRSEPTGRR